MAMFITLDYVTLSIIAVGMVLLVAERCVKRFGHCERKEKIVSMIHELRELFLDVSSRAESAKASSDETPDIVQFVE